MKVIVDTDPGIDDAVALGILLSRKDIDILGITCVSGNVGVDQCTSNALKIVEAFDRTDIPVFKGADKPLLACEHTGGYFHGLDGLGFVHHDEPNKQPLQEEHAVSAINRLAKEHPQEITLIALGPLTNLALAVRLNANLSNLLKEVVIMGGNYKGEGNITMAAEFNFYMDPIAAHIVLEDFICPKYLVSWELCKVQYLTLDDYKEFSMRGNKKAEFFRKIFVEKKFYEKLPGICDAVAVAIAIDRNLILKQHEVYATVCFEGVQTRGLVLVDWNPQYRQIGPPKEKNLIIVDEMNVDLYKRMVIESTL